jgi:Na+/H+-dicarboxylate symporter
MCTLIGLGIGLFLLLIGGFFLFLNTKGEPKFLKLISLFSFEGGAILLGLLIILLTILPILGIGTGTCESDFFN